MDRPRRATALIPNPIPPEWIDDTADNNPEGDAEELHNIKKPTRERKKKEQSPDESDDNPIPSTSKGVVVQETSKSTKQVSVKAKANQSSNTSKESSRPTKKVNKAAKRTTKKKTENEKTQKNQTSMRTGWKMPKTHTLLENQYCAKWLFLKTGGDAEIVIRELDDSPWILYVLSGAAGFPRLRKHLLRHINKNRRIGKKLNKMDFSELPDEVPPFVAAHPILAAEAIEGAYVADGVLPNEGMEISDEDDYPDNPDDPSEVEVDAPPSKSSKSSSKKSSQG